MTSGSDEGVKGLGLRASGALSLGFQVFRARGAYKA